MLRLLSLPALALLVALAAGGCGGGSGSSAAVVETADGPSSPFTGAELPGREPAPDLVLRDQEGRLVRLSDERGRLVLLTFLYTNCRDVCPLIAETLNAALQRLGPARASVRVLAVSVDPKGDTPTRVGSYARIHRLLPEFRYLIGTRAELEPVWRAYDVLAFARDPESALVDHTAYTLLIDREGRRRLLYSADAPASDVVHDVRRLLEG